MAFRKISELSSSLTPSGSGIIPIVINGTTFGTTLDAIKDQINSVLTPQYASSSITSSVDTLIGNVSSLNTFTSSADGRLDSIEIFTGSLNDYYATDQELLELREYFNTYSSSNNTVNTQQNIRLDALDGLEIATGSLLTQIETEKGRIDAILLSSDADKDSFKEIVDLINSVDTENDNAFGTYVLNTNDRLDSIEVESGSIRSEFNSYTSSANNILEDHELQRWLHGERLTSIETFTGSLSDTVNDITTIKGRLDKLEIESGSIRDEFNSFTSSYLIVSQSFNDRISILEGYHIPQPTPNATPNPTSTPNATPNPTSTPNATPQPTPVPTVEYELYTAYLSRDEGQSAFFELRWTNGTSGATVGFTLSGTATPAQEFGGMIEAMDYTKPTDMFFTVNNNGFVILEIPINEDSQTEGTETIILTLDAQDSNGNPTGGLQKTVTINDTSELQDWEIVASTHDEGITFNHILKTEHVPAGTEYFWYVGVGIGYPWTPASAADFVGGVLPSGSGTIPVYNETLAISDSIPISIVADSLTEGDEVYQIIVKDGSPSNPGQHRVIQTMTITDSSLTPVTTPTPTPTPLPVDFTIRFQLDGGNSTYSLKDLSIPQSFGNTHNHTITGYNHDGFETVTTNVVANNGYTFNGNDGELTYAINGSPISNNQGNSTQNTNGFFTTYNSVTDSWDLSIQIGSVGSDLITEGEIIILTISGNAISDPLPTSTPNATPNPTGYTTTLNVSTVQNFTPSLSGLTLWYTEVAQSYVNNQNQYDTTLNWIEVGTFNPIGDCSQGSGPSNTLSITLSGDHLSFIYTLIHFRDSNGTVIYGSRMSSLCNYSWQNEYHKMSGSQILNTNPSYNFQFSIYSNTLSIVPPTPTATIQPTPVPTSTEIPTPIPTSTVQPNPTPTSTTNLQDIGLTIYINNDGGVNPWTGGATYSEVRDHLCTYGATSTNGTTRQTDGDPNNPQTGDRFYAGGFPLEPFGRKFLKYYPDMSDVANWKWIDVDNDGYITVSGFSCTSPTPTPTSTVAPPSPTSTPNATPNPTPTSTVAPPSPTSTPEPDPTAYPTATPNATPNPTPNATPAPDPTPTSTPNSTPNPTATVAPISCISAAPLNINVESEYDSNSNTTTFKYITSDLDGNGGLFGCINVDRGSTVTINVTGSAPNLETHPIKITNINDQGQHEAPLPNVVSTWNAGNPYTLTWEVPCDVGITQYQYQCVNHAHMRGVINVSGTCPTPTPSPTSTPNATPNPTPANNTIYVHTP
jgi:hypothetical protein